MDASGQPRLVGPVLWIESKKNLGQLSQLSGTFVA